MKTIINTVVMIMFAIGSMAGVYYLAVPAEHQIFKFFALVLMILVFGGLCFQLGATLEDATIKVDPKSSKNRNEDLPF